MTDAPAAITAQLVDVRNVAAHKSVRLELHVPAEQAGLVMAAFDVAALVLASINAKRILYTRIYAIGAAIIAAFKVLGIVVDGQDVQILDLLAKGVALIPLVLAFARTDPSTPTGEPSAEYADPHNDDPIGA